MAGSATAVATPTGIRRAVALPVAIWVLHVALPVLGLWLLLVQPPLDVAWEQHHAHFGLVLGAAALSLALGARVNEQARRRSDARLFLVSLAFLAAAGFLGLHALATPGVLLEGRNAGFAVATPVGLLLAAVLALASALELPPAVAARVIAVQGWARAGLAVLLVGWAVVSLSGLGVLRRELPANEAYGPLLAAAVAGAVLYGAAALRYFTIHRRRPAAILLSVITAFVLLAEAMVAIALSANWHASWWEWHLLMLVAFAFVAYSAHVQYRRGGTRSGVWAGVGLAQTLAAVRRDHTAALEALIAAVQAGPGVRWGQVRAGLAERFDLSDAQVEVLERGAAALAAEREQIRRLGALVAVGQQVSVIRAEEEFLDGAQRLVDQGFGPGAVRLGVLRAGKLVFGDGGPPREGALGWELSVKGHPAGVLEAVGGFAERDRSVLASLAAQLSIALENTRLYAQLEGLFRSYMSPDVAAALLADPQAAALGGALVEVTVLMADLAGFTPFAEHTAPDQVVGMLNAYYGAVVPVVLAAGGTVVQFVGDAVMALWGAPVPQPDHARRAAGAALGLQAAAAAAARPDWPRFRVGVNTGPALVGNIGSQALRGFTAIGDTTNVAARLQTAAPPGGVVIGPAARAALGGDVEVDQLGPLAVKGRAESVEAFLLRRLRPAAAASRPMDAG